MTTEPTPNDIRNATFKTGRKGYDPDEVRMFLDQVARRLEECQQHATAMEARARAAVSRLQEYQSQATAEVQVAAAPPAPAEPAAAAAPPAPAAVQVPNDEAETISRTLLLAQRTADTTVAEAKAEAEQMKAEAKAEAESTLDSTREMSARLLEEARTEARAASAEEREQAESEVEALKARREFLVGDVDQLEQFLIDQRERLRGAARQIEALCERVPSGLGEVRRPPLSAAAEDDTDDDGGEITGEVPVITSSATDETAELFRTPGAAAPFGDGADEAASAAGEAVAEAAEGAAAAAEGETPRLPLPGGSGNS